MSLILQKYTAVNWPMLRGVRPFIAAGPRFIEYTTTKTLTGTEWRFKRAFLDELKHVGESADRLSREVAAELLLRDGILAAIWAENGREALPEELRWNAAIAQLADEITADGSLQSWLIEMLSGVPEASYYPAFFSDTELRFVTGRVPD